MSYKYKIDENKNELQNKIDEKERMLLDLIEKLNKEMKEVKEVEKYVREKIIIEENIEKKEKKKYTFSREIIENKKVLNLDISIYLIEEEIKFIIKEIQDNFKSNPLIYEASFVINDLIK